MIFQVFYSQQSSNIQFTLACIDVFKTFPEGQYSSQASGAIKGVCETSEAFKEKCFHKY